MKTKILFLLIVALFICLPTQAQFWKKVADRASKAAEETVLNKVDEKTSKKTNKTMDTIFDGGSKSKTMKKTPNHKESSSNGPKLNNDNSSSSAKRNAKSVKDFIPGNKVLYSDTFSNDAEGDFPITWNTNASAEVVTFEGDDVKWLSLSNNGQYTPDGITNIPENSTFEFDLFVPDNYNYYSYGIFMNIVEVTEKSKDFMKWTHFTLGVNGVRLWFHPSVAGGSKDAGRTGVYTYANGSKVMENMVNNDQFTLNSNLVHVSVWRQKSRMRVYFNDKKVWDIPRAFDDSNYNSITFSIGNGTVESNFYVANLHLAIAREDKRHALLETGEFETNEILFDVGKASIQESSFSILNEIGAVLKENPNLKINIIGHTDSDGQTSTNQLLSEMRAKSVKEYITDNYPIMGNRLKTMGEGASKPVASNDTNEGKRKNRRVQFIRVN